MQYCRSIQFAERLLFLQFSASAYFISVVENDRSVTVSVTRTGGATRAASVRYATSNGTATANKDYSDFDRRS
ncbi:MAG: hypothetical protein LC647_10565 [Beggiatoa sp.]|nr:hypothetical protein [Beggiatoa sp.]